MELKTLLRECYEEAGIRGGNTAKYDQRLSTIQRIIEKKLLTAEDYTILSDYILQMNNGKQEELINKLEGYFCEEDDSFTQENSKELNIVVQVLLYAYLTKNNNMKIALSIISGNCIGNKIYSKLIYEKVEEFIKEQRYERRLSCQDDLELRKSKIHTVISSIKKSKKEVGEEEYEYDTETVDGLVNSIEVNYDNITYAFDVMKDMVNRIDVLSEESDILWWLTNEWSDIRECPFSKLKQEEAVILLPYELSNKVQYTLMPVSAKALLIKAISYSGEGTNKITLDMAIDAVEINVFDDLELEFNRITKLQPVLMAIALKKEYWSEDDPELWKKVFANKYGKKVEEFVLSAEEFAYHVLLELELWYTILDEE